MKSKKSKKKEDPYVKYADHVEQTIESFEPPKIDIVWRMKAAVIDTPSIIRWSGPKPCCCCCCRN